jgi:hypothetical protein
MLTLCLLVLLAYASASCRLACDRAPKAGELCFLDRVLPASHDELLRQMDRLLKQAIHDPLRPHELQRTILLGRMYQYHLRLIPLDQPEWHDVFLRSHLDRARMLANQYATCL